jgi:uncharacterized protein (DUF608 family)
MGKDGKTISGHYYDNHFKSASAVARYAADHKEDLQKRTFGFLKDFYDSDAPLFVLDQINSQLNTFVTSGLLNKEGALGMIEGLTPEKKWGPVATTDVAVYGSIPIATFFPEQQRKILIAHQKNQHKNGAINHGLQRDFSSEYKSFGAIEKVRLDLHPQWVGMMVREVLWSGDDDFLKASWKSMQDAMEYCLRERDVNKDSMPDMEGIMCSYDNFPMYGTSAYVGSQWLSSLAGMVTCAQRLGDKQAETRYASFLEKGKAIFQDKLWNGEYYRLWNDEGGAHGGKDEGCLTDQVIGQWTLRFMGLGDIVENDDLKKALRTVLKMSYKRDFGLRNCSWPGQEPWAEVPDRIWVDQANTCWSGVELAFASFLMYEGLYDEALAVTKTVDARYRKAGRYFDHQEFGGHYFRPMSAFGLVFSMAGMALHDEKLTFAPNVPRANLKLFFTTPTGTGHYVRRGGGRDVTLQMSTGTQRIKTLELALARPGRRTRVSLDGQSLPHEGGSDGKRVTITLEKPIELLPQQQLRVQA